ncbi:Tripeptide aminopeptidase [Planctomycetales bacterium 10988]|nr:Tripeptide aminopeptidase [Planctomycetales bacterium 10988]
MEPDLKRARQLVMEMLPIPGTSGQEGQIIAFLKKKLQQGGASPNQIVVDDAHTRSELGGEIGNLVLKIPGAKGQPRRLLMAHVDTVPLCQGCDPLWEGEFVRSANPATGLGADNRAGAAVLLSTALEILSSKRPHPPLTFLWPVQEEVGLYGSRHASLQALGKPQLAFNWDGGTPTRVTVGATGAYRMRIHIDGLATHAGAAPEWGISATAIASLAIAWLVREGWHGQITKNGNQGTANVGYISGGKATNVVTDSVEVWAEARSHDPTFRRQILKAYKEAFEQAAQEVRNVSGARGKIHFKHRLDYESFKLDNNEPCVLAAERAIEGLGKEPERVVANGGLDANWLTERGIPTVTLGCGQESPHTVQERLNMPAFEEACRIALAIATEIE